MVKSSFTLSSLALILSLTGSGCGVIKKVWGEGPPHRATVSESNTAPLPAFSLVFGDDDVVAVQTLAIWRNNVLSSFQQVKGAEKNFLKTSEIETLVKLGFLKLDSEPKVSVERAITILKLLGYKDGISTQNVSALFDWVSENREQARIFYKTFVSTDTEKPLEWNTKEIVADISIFGSLVARTGNERLESAHIAQLVNPWIPNSFPHAKAGIKSGIDLLIAFFSSLCGDRVESDAWNGYRIGKCMSDFTIHYQPGTLAMDFALGKIDPRKDSQAIKASADAFPNLVAFWLKDHHHPLFEISRISDFSKAIDIPPPYAVIDLTAWIPKLNKESTSTGFNPVFAVELTQVIQNWINLTLGKFSVEQACSEKSWRDCPYTGSYDTLERLYNDQYAPLLQHRNLGLVRKVAFDESVAAFLLKKLDDDHDGYLSNDIKDLISVVVSILDTTGYAENVIARALEKPLHLNSTQDTLHSIHREGLSELIAFAADLIPDRDQNPKNFIARLGTQVLTPEQKLSYRIDALGITAFLYTYDLMGSLRDDYLNHYNFEKHVVASSEFIRRRSAVENLPVMLHDHFPDIYNSCLEWGFERTCGVIFTEVLASGNKETHEIATSELDTISLTAILLESMMNRCDQNHDGYLTTGIFHPTDEKHCMLDVSTALAERLMHANIVKATASAQNWINLVKGVAPVRWAAAGAISRGTLRGIAIKGLPPFSFFSKAATLGSVMSLAAEFMSGDKTKAIESGAYGPSDTPGDELLYQQQLTDHFLVSEENSRRK